MRILRDNAEKLAFLLTAVCMTTIGSLLSKLGVSLPGLWNEVIGLIVGTIIALTLGPAVWGWPKLVVSWEDGGGRPIAGDTVHFRMIDTHDRRLVQHHVRSSGESSLLSRWVFRKLEKADLRIVVGLTAQRFVTRRDVGNVRTTTRPDSAGFVQYVPRPTSASEAFSVRMEWRPHPHAMIGTIPVEHRLETDNDAHRLLRAVVILDPHIKAVDLS